MTTEETRQTIAEYKNTAVNLRERAKNNLADAESLDAEISKLEKELARKPRAEVTPPTA